MSGAGAPSIAVDGAGLTIEIVASQWHTEVMDGLVAGAVRAAEAAGAGYRVTRVAGAIELTVVVPTFNESINVPLVIERLEVWQIVAHAPSFIGEQGLSLYPPAAG